MLTGNQIKHFETFGFLTLRELLTPEEMEVAAKEFNIGMEHAQATTEHRGTRKQFNWTNLGPDSTFLGSLLEDPRFLSSAKQLLGSEVVGHYANGNLFDGDRTEWHPDSHNLSRRGIKFAFYLQPLDQDSGALRFIPGSHKVPLHTDIGNFGLKDSNIGTSDPEGIGVDEFPAFVACSRPGDVIVFDNRVWHASWGGRQGRKMCSAGYFAVPTCSDEEAIIRDIAESEVSIAKVFPLLRRPKHWVLNSSGSPIRQRWIDYLRAHQFDGL